MTPSRVVLIFTISFLSSIAVYWISSVIYHLFWPRLPEELKYKEKVLIQSNRFVNLIGAGLGIGLMVLMIVSGDWNDPWTYVLVLVFLAAVIMFGWTALPSQSYLEVSTTGFRWRHFNMTRSYVWEEIEEFRINTGGFLRGAISYTFSDPERKTGKLSRWVTGGDELIPSNFGKKPIDILALLNQFKYMGEPSSG